MSSPTPDDTSQRLTKGGRRVRSIPTRVLVLAGIVGAVAAAGFVLVVFSLTRPEPAPVGPPDGADAIPTFYCDVGSGAGGGETNCVVRGSNDPAELPVSGDDVVDGPIVTAAPSDTYPEVTPNGNVSADDGTCMMEYLQARFTPEEVQLYASGQTGPRSDEWLAVNGEANQECHP